MKLSRNLLEKFVAIKLSDDALSDVLSERAFEVEGYEVIGPKFTEVITAQVTAIEKHPNADRLRVITLTDGSHTYGPVVCGAHNFEVGAIVPLALPGAHIPHN